MHFGLGASTKIDSIEIRWPSGASDVLKNLEPDKFYSVLEGKGIVPPNRFALCPAFTEFPARFRLPLSKEATITSGLKLHFR